MTFGEWLKRERERRDWTQASVARKVGVGRSQMNNIEAGRSRAGDETLQALYALFETTPAEVRADMERSDDPAPESPPSPQQHPGIDAMIALLQAPPKANAKLLAELEALRGAKLDRPVMLPGEALDWALLRLRPPPE